MYGVVRKSFPKLWRRWWVIQVVSTGGIYSNKNMQRWLLPWQEIDRDLWHACLWKYKTADKFHNFSKLRKRIAVSCLWHFVSYRTLVSKSPQNYLLLSVSVSHLLFSRLSISFPAFRASSSLRLVPADILITCFKVLAPNLGGNRETNNSLHSCWWKRCKKFAESKVQTADCNQTKLDRRGVNSESTTWRRGAQSSAWWEGFTNTTWQWLSRHFPLPAGRPCASRLFIFPSTAVFFFFSLQWRRERRRTGFRLSS